MSTPDKQDQLRALATALLNESATLRARSAVETDEVAAAALFRDAQIALAAGTEAMLALKDNEVARLDRLTAEIGRLLDRLRGFGARDVAERIVKEVPALSPPAASPPPRPRPGATGVVPAILAAAETAGVDGTLALTLAQVESGLDPRADRKGGRSGLFAAPDALWSRLARAAGVQAARAAEASPEQQIDLLLPALKTVVSQLADALGAAPRPELVLAAWRFGHDAALQLAREDPERAAREVMAADLVTAWQVGVASVGDIFDRLRNALIIARDRLRAVVAPPEAPQDAPQDPSPSANPPPGPLVTTSPPVIRPRARPVALSLPSIALEEMEAVTYDAQGRKLHDNHPEFFDTVIKYFRSAGDTKRQRGTKDAWSAAFISYCVKEARRRVPDAPGFPLSIGHYIYIGAGMKTVDPEFAYGRGGYPHLTVSEGRKAVPRVGDLVGGTREDHAHLRSFADIKTHLRAVAVDSRYFFSHTDIVTEVHSDRVTVVGGNVGRTKVGDGTIDTRDVLLGKDGALAEEQEAWFVLHLDF